MAARHIVLACFLGWPLPIAATARAQSFVLASGEEVQAAAWQVQGDFKKDGDLSGLACNAGDHCLMVSDEKSWLQAFALDRAQRLIRVGQPTALLAGGLEADLEAVTFDGGQFYATGSHAVGRNTGAVEPSRYQVFRIGLDAAGDVVEQQASQSLTAVIAADPVLGGRLHRPLDEASRGIDIEGLAARDGRLLFGLRSPVENGNAYVLSVAGAELFDETAGPPRADRRALPLGDGAGIRDLAAVEGGILALSGPSVDTSSAPFAVWYWPDGDEPVLIGRFSGLGEAKPEGLLPLAVTDAGWRILVVSDSAENGRPLEFEVPAPN